MTAGENRIQLVKSRADSWLLFLLHQKHIELLKNILLVLFFWRISRKIVYYLKVKGFIQSAKDVTALASQVSLYFILLLWTLIIVVRINLSPVVFENQNFKTFTVSVLFL